MNIETKHYIKFFIPNGLMMKEEIHGISELISADQVEYPEGTWAFEIYRRNVIYLDEAFLGNEELLGERYYVSELEENEDEI